MAPAMPTAPQNTARPEMWWMMLAKSKTMRFFAVSCEFVLFLGCLWLTLVTIIPEATGWLWGSVNQFFLVGLGFAVDAALPEAWLHVVDQWTEKKRQHLLWSIPIAIAMLLLVVANMVYTKLTGSSGTQPGGATEILVNSLLVARMFIGICYVTIRECQSFIDRKHYTQQAAQPLVSVVEIEELIRHAMSVLAEQQEVRLSEIASEQRQMLALSQHICWGGSRPSKRVDPFWTTRPLSSHPATPQSRVAKPGQGQCEREIRARATVPICG